MFDMHFYIYESCLIIAVTFPIYNDTFYLRRRFLKFSQFSELVYGNIRGNYFDILFMIKHEVI